VRSPPSPDPSPRTGVGIPVALLLVLVAMASVPNASATPQPVGIAAAGDIVCEPTGPYFDASNPAHCQFRATARAIRDEIAAGTVERVLPLGDNQYHQGSLSEYRHGYDPTWGTFKSLTEPAAGNHEWLTPNADGFFDYFSPTTPQIDPGRYYYSYDLGAWHIIVLDSNCSSLPGSPSNPDNGCVRNSPQMTWLEGDLARDSATCTLAYWHHPRFSSGERGDIVKTTPFWRALYAAGADVILTAHRHMYERFQPQDPDGNLDQQNGIVEFVVGTGGDDHGMIVSPPSPNEVVRDNTTFGYLHMTLETSGYTFDFVPVAGGSFTDSGAGSCH
jgi:acid phosphatase type 7